jgi:large subunit ribosomal protein L25
VAVTFTAETRTDFGKGAARRLRRAGRIPAVMYGRDREVAHISLPAHELTLALRVPSATFTIDLDGSATLVKPRDVQRDPVRRDIEHVDLIVIDEAEARSREAKSKQMVAAAEAAAEAAATAAAPKGDAEGGPAAEEAAPAETAGAAAAPSED